MKPIKPWGIIQRYCFGISKKSKQSLQSHLPVIPMVDMSNKNSKSNAEKTRELKLTFYALQIILHDYVVNTDILKDLKKSNRDKVNVA